MAKKKSEYIDITGLFQNYLKHWWWFVISVIICVGLAFCLSRIMKQKDDIRASVVIAQDDTSPETGGTLAGLLGTNGNVEDEIYLLSSHAVFVDAVKQLGFNKLHTVHRGFLNNTLEIEDYPIDVHVDPAVLDTLGTALLFTVEAKDGIADIKVKARKHVIVDIDDAKLPASVKTPYGNFVVTATPQMPKNEKVKSKISVMGYDNAAEALAEDISIELASKRSNVIEMAMLSTNSDYAKQVLNAIISQYNERTLNQRNKKYAQTAQFLEERLNLIANDLHEAEADLQDYKENQGIVDVSSEAAYNLTAKGTAEQALIQAQTNSEIIKMTRDFVNNPRNEFEVIPVSDNLGSAGASINQYNNLVINRMDLVRTAKSGNITLKNLEEQIRVLRQSITTSLDRAYETSLVSVRDARAEANKAQAKLSNIPGQERAFINLKRQQEVKQRLYLYLLQRREETAILMSNNLPKAEIIDVAYTRVEPVGTSPKMMLIMGFIIGLLIPPFILYLRGLLRTKFSDRKEFEKLSDATVLGEICQDKSGEALVVSSTSTTSTSELFRMARTNLQFVLSNPGHKVVLVTSTRAGEGKSFVSINMAASLALLGKRVLLIGMDIRNPQLANYLNISTPGGLTVYLSRGGDYKSLINSTEVPGMDVIVAGPVPPNPGELLMSDAVDKLFAHLRDEYDYIIVDSAPVGMVSDTFTLDRLADATIYVVRANFTTRNEVEFLDSIIENKRLQRVGVIINGTTTKKGYGYGYGYGYGQK